MKHYNNNSGYSIVISLLMVGFLIVVTSGVFNLVLGELNDNRGRENYLKAFAAAEGSLELALFQIKDKGYGYYGASATTSSNTLLASNPLDVKEATDPIISYNLNSKDTIYKDRLGALGYAIVPLFVIDDPIPPSTDEVITSVTDISMVPIGGTDLSDVTWNIVGQDDGISGVGRFDDTTTVNGQLRDFLNTGYKFEDISIPSFLSSIERRNKPLYLILFNSTSNEVQYELSSSGEFTKPTSIIESSAKVGKYKQNLDTKLNNTEFLNILRYSIYSN